jgi:hypothetical protein
MSFSFRNLKQLEDGIKISIPADENGMIGRECPNPACHGYFKIKPGTGLKGKNLPCHCPYCGHTKGHNHFWTHDQAEYVNSVMKNEVSKALEADTHDWDQQLRQSTRNSFIKLSVKFNRHTHPIRYYREKQLETLVTCDNCTLKYALYGVFAFCPDCGTYNSLQILSKNLELVEKEILLGRNTEDKELAERLVEDALENAVSAIDGFGRAICAAFSNKATNPQQAQDISFQNIQNARARVSELFGFDFTTGIDSDKWNMIVKCFQKRHLLAHKMGVIDQEYIKKTTDPGAVVGRKVVIKPEEVSELTELLRIMGNNLASTLK